MPVFTEGKGVSFPRWQIDEDPSLMLMHIDAPTDAEHPDVLRYAHMLSEALFKQGRREPNWWKYPRGTRRFNKIYGTKFSSKAPRGVVTGVTRRTAQPRGSHATKRDRGSGVPSALTLWEGSHSDVPLHSKFWYVVDQGTYHITPVSNPDQPRDVRYDLRFNKKPFGWEKIGPYHKTLERAVSAARRHYTTLQ